MILAILALGLGLRIISLNQSLWLDEAISALASQKFSLWTVITEYAKGDFHPPLYFIILWIWTKAFSISEVALRTPSVLFGILTVYLTYLIGAKLYSKKIGLISSLLLATNPLHIYYSQEARMYALACLAVALNFFLISKIIKNEKVKLSILILSNIFILSSDYVAYFTFPSQLFFLYLFKRKKEFWIWFKALIIAFLIWIIWIPIFLSQLEIGVKTSESIPIWKSVVGGFDVKSILLTPIKFVIGRISLTNKVLYYSLLIPICSLIGLLIVKGVKTTNTFTRNLLLSWLLIPTALAAFLSIVLPIFSYFRLLFVLPPFLILVALGVYSFKNKTSYFLLGIVLSIQIFSSVMYLFNSKYQREDWKGLVGYLRSKQNVITLFESSGILPPFEYYSSGNINSVGALKNFPAKNKSDIIDLDIIKQNDIFLVDYLIEISDPGRYVSSELTNAGYKLIDTKDFHGVGFVYHYVK